MQEGISNCAGDFVAPGLGNLRVGFLLQMKNDRVPVKHHPADR